MNVARTAVITLSSAALILGALTHATAQSRRTPLEELSDDQLRERGFQWEASEAFRGSTTSGFIAVGPGFIFHGLGHYSEGDRATGTTLILSEVIGLALGLSGVAAVALSQDSSIDNLGIALGHVGGSIFVTGWFIDIEGSFQGSSNERPSPPLFQGTVHGSADYRAVSVPGFEALHLLDANLTFELGPLTLRPRTSQDALLSYQLYAGDLGLRVVEGADPSDYLAIFATVEWANFGPDSGGQSVATSGKTIANPLRVKLTSEISLDLSTFVTHLKNTFQVVTFGVGFGRSVGERAFFPGPRDTTWLIYEHRFLVALSKKVVLEPFYRYDESITVAPIAAELGVFGVDLHLTPRSALRVKIGVEGGDGIAATAGISAPLF
jgi:hypothetical protein